MNHRRRRACQCLWVGAMVAFCAAPALATDPPSKDRDTKKEELGKRLVREAVDQRDEGVMAGMIRLMREIHKRLDLDFDPGTNTQRLQQEIMDKLNRAIKEAASRRRKSKRNKPRFSGDKRKMQPGDAEKKAARPSDASAEAQGSSPDESTAKGAPSGDGPTGDAQFDARRGWGALPPREREEVIQGAGEEYLEAFRVWIERYYRALQDADD